MENDVNCQVAKTLNKGIQYLLDNDKFTHFTWISDDNEYYPNFLNDCSHPIQDDPFPGLISHSLLKQFQ